MCSRAGAYTGQRPGDRYCKATRKGKRKRIIQGGGVKTEKNAFMCEHEHMCVHVQKRLTEMTCSQRPPGSAQHRRLGPQSWGSSQSEHVSGKGQVVGTHTTHLAAGAAGAASGKSMRGECLPLTGCECTMDFLDRSWKNVMADGTTVTVNEQVSALPAASSARYSNTCAPAVSVTDGLGIQSTKRVCVECA